MPVLQKELAYYTTGMITEHWTPTSAIKLQWIVLAVHTRTPSPDGYFWQVRKRFDMRAEEMGPGLYEAVILLIRLCSNIDMHGSCSCNI